MTRKRRRIRPEDLPQDDGLVKFRRIICRPEVAVWHASYIMRVEHLSEPHWSKDPAYHWVAETRKKRGATE